MAASQTISAHLIPQCIAYSNWRYPDIDFVLHDRPQRWVLESIRQGEVDFGIVIDPGAATDLQCETVLAEPFLLLCRGDHPFARQDSVSWQELQHQRLARRKNRSLSTAAEALWEVVRHQARQLTSLREHDPLYQL